MNEFFLRWQHLPEDIDPVFLSLGALQLRYYGLMYLASILVFYALARYRIKKESKVYSLALLDDFLSWGIIGVLLGARLGYVLFYNLAYYIGRPLEIFWPISMVDGQATFGISGLSYHGGLAGLILATWLFCRRRRIDAIAFVDFFVPAAPLGYMFGRIGNFLNSELYGRVTASPWGMYFPTAPTYELRHASQLYEAFFEGLVLFVLLWGLRKKDMFSGALLAIYLMGYAFVRFFIEYWREPDEQVGFVFRHLSMGQMLCLIMFLAGFWYYLFRQRVSKAHGS
jgi:phosphatidylglycerol:prolipoprotein diacylglycerol transferase